VSPAADRREIAWARCFRRYLFSRRGWILAVREPLLADLAVVLSSGGPPREAVLSIVTDYRTSAGVGIEHDQVGQATGRVLEMLVTVVQQTGEALGYDAAALWRPWAPDLVHHTVDSGHFMAEEAPERITARLRQLIPREDTRTMS
jgi:thioesterase domain-containing protein